MLTQGPPKNKWVTHLVPLLSGKALKAYTGLSEAASKEYGTVKETILKYFNIGITTYRNRFKAARMKENESAQEFSTRLTDLFMKWSSACRNIDDLRQLILVDKFVSDLPLHIRSWLWDKKPATLAVAAELHDDYVASRREEAPFNKSFNRQGNRMDLLQRRSPRMVAVRNQTLASQQTSDLQTTLSNYQSLILKKAPAVLAAISMAI